MADAPVTPACHEQINMHYPLGTGVGELCNRLMDELDVERDHCLRKILEFSGKIQKRDFAKVL